MDELAALVKTQKEFRECSIMETWFHCCFSDFSTAVPGFITIQVDRDVERSSKFVSEKWCNLVT